MVNWESPPVGSGRVKRVLDIAGIGRISIKQIGRNEYRLYVNGERTAYSGDSIQQAEGMGDRLVQSLFTERHKK